jgi:hypothetical protein
VGELNFDENSIKILKDNPSATIEIRGLKLCKEGFKNFWPNFSTFQLNVGGFKKVFNLPEREQSRKRKDFPLDITQFVVNNLDKKIEICAKFVKNSTSQEKNNDFDYYAIGVYLIQPIQTHEIVNYITNYEVESMKTTLTRINKHLISDDDIISENLKMNLVCPITRSSGSLKIPVRGFKCDHIE